MSLSAKSQAIAVRKKLQIETLDAGLREWGFEFQGGKLWDVATNPEDSTSFWNPSKLHFWEIDAIEKGINDFDFDKMLEGKSSGARYLARRLKQSNCSYSEKPTISSILSDWAALKELRHWIYQQDADYVKRLDLSAGKLMYLGIRFAWQAERFAELYSKVHKPERPWGSCYQPSHGKVKALALTPNYNRLPVWVKKTLIESTQWIETERVGNIWRLIDCAKAWKHAPHLPKGIAEKIGRMSVKSRILAFWAWEAVAQDRTVRDFYQRDWREYGHEVSRATVIQSFWVEFRRLSQLNIVALIQERQGTEKLYKKDHNCLRQLAEIMIGLPHGFLFKFWGRHRHASSDVYLKAIASYGNPSDVCQNLFGNAGKRTVELFKNASEDAWRWAVAVCENNADAVQKVLAMENIIKFQSEATAFLESLHLHSRIRLLGATTFKYRGQVQPISDDHVRDTGYLWKNLHRKPDLGRIRCWFSAHEQLSAAFVKELPDEALPIPAGWERVDGLCAVNGSWQLEFPKRVATLKYYGEVLRNCVGGYGPAIKSGRSVVFVVREAGLLTHCVEVSNKKINQFYRAGNSTADYRIQSSVECALQQAGLII